MSEFIVEYSYSPKEEVSIKKLKVVGIVVGLYYGDTGKQYQVSYFLKGDKKVVYLYEEEIGPVSDDDKFGFVE